MDLQAHLVSRSSPHGRSSAATASIQHALRQIFDDAAAERITIDAATRRIAEKRLQAAT